MSEIEIVTLETPSLGDRSYLVHDGQVAAVVDPQRDIDRVLDLAAEHEVEITDVLETHVHNDYVTGGYALARHTGARYHLAAADEVDFDRNGLVDGETVKVGAFTMRALHTPGHTPTHLAYVIAGDAGDLAVCTGGSLLFGAVGRTDLVSASETEALTRAQHRSARRLTDTLDDDVAVLPTHGFGSFCASASSPDTEASTIGDERRTNLATTVPDEDAFVTRLLAGLDDHPRYYAHMGPRNRLGPDEVDLAPPVRATPDDLRARIDAGEWVVDLRSGSAYAADHLLGSVNVGLGEHFSTYLGWLVPWGMPVTLVGDSADDVAAAQRQLVRIGIDRPAAMAVGGVERYGAEVSRASYRAVDFEAVAAQSAAGELTILDVRLDSEVRESAIAGALHVPLHELPRRMSEVPADRDVWVHCGSGYRSAIAASLLERTGRRPVLIDDLYDRAATAGLDVR